MSGDLGELAFNIRLGRWVEDLYHVMEFGRTGLQ